MIEQLNWALPVGTAPSKPSSFYHLSLVLTRLSSSFYGDNEVLLGKWFKRTGKRNQIFLATKFSFVKGQEGFSELDSSAEYTKKACAESLKLLGVDYIDLYYMHRANPKTPIEETMRAMVELKA